MKPIHLHTQLGQAKHRPAIVCLTAAAAFSVWHSYGHPRFYLETLSSRIAFTGDPVVDAELYRGAGNLLLILFLLAMIKLVLQQSLVDYQLGLGHWRKAPLLVAATPVLPLFGYLAATMPEYWEIYPFTPGLDERSPLVFLLHIGVLATYYIAWELLFRGYIQSALIPTLGVWGGIAAQTLASTLAHTDRPASELLGSIVAGMVWGGFAYRTNSLWPVFLHHLLLGIALDYWICFGGLR